MTRRPIAAVVLAIPLAASAASTDAPQDAPRSLEAAVARADAAVRAMQSRLAARLAEAMKQGGPAAAVTVCRDDALRLTEETARTSGVSLGRTSDRLRNPANVPPPWAEATVAAAGGKKATEVSPRVVDLGDRVGVLRPIAVAQACTRCHGGPDSLAPGVAAELATAYPRDRAVGYVEGDHRGFVWAVVPKE